MTPRFYAVMCRRNSGFSQWGKQTFVCFAVFEIGNNMNDERIELVAQQIAVRVSYRYFSYQNNRRILKTNLRLFSALSKICLGMMVHQTNNIKA
jgi:hypothetical protein